MFGLAPGKPSPTSRSCRNYFDTLQLGHDGHLHASGHVTRSAKLKVTLSGSSVRGKHRTWEPDARSVPFCAHEPIPVSLYKHGRCKAP